MTVVYYKIRKETAVQDLNAIGWKARTSNDIVARNLFNRDCDLNMYIACMIDGESSSFYYPDLVRCSEALDPPLPTELGEIL